jgi:hypothetical protein
MVNGEWWIVGGASLRRQTLGITLGCRQRVGGALTLTLQNENR